MRGSGSLGSFWRTTERPFEGRLLAGVCSGLADRFELDVTLARLAFLVLVLCKGLGLLLYLGLWILLPSAGSGGRGIRATARDNIRGLRGDLGLSQERFRAAWTDRQRRAGAATEVRNWIALALIGVGGMLLLWSLGLLAWITPLRALGIACLLAGVAMLVRLSNG